jgi:hypothetical protein
LERRTTERVEALVVVMIGGHKRHAVTRNASERGLLIATRSKLELGDRLELQIPSKDTTIQVTGRVVRIDEPPDAEWRYLVGLELDEPLPHVVIEAGKETAAKLVGVI